MVEVQNLAYHSPPSGLCGPYPSNIQKTFTSSQDLQRSHPLTVSTQSSQSYYQLKSHIKSQVLKSSKSSMGEAFYLWTCETKEASYCLQKYNGGDRLKMPVIDILVQKGRK